MPDPAGGGERGCVLAGKRGGRPGSPLDATLSGLPYSRPRLNHVDGVSRSCFASPTVCSTDGARVKLEAVLRAPRESDQGFVQGGVPWGGGPYDAPERAPELPSCAAEETHVNREAGAELPRRGAWEEGRQGEAWTRGRQVRADFLGSRGQGGRLSWPHLLHSACVPVPWLGRRRCVAHITRVGRSSLRTHLLTRHGSLRDTYRRTQGGQTPLVPLKASGVTLRMPPRFPFCRPGDRGV